MLHIQPIDFSTFALVTIFLPLLLKLRVHLGDAPPMLVKRMGMYLRCWWKQCALQRPTIDERAYINKYR